MGVEIERKFLVEGDSAGGSAKQAHNREFQAIMPLRGKILNSEGLGLSRVMSNAELNDLVTASCNTIDPALA